MKLAVEAFEVIKAPGGARLLRLMGHWDGRPPEVRALRVAVDGERFDLRPLPGSPPANGDWRAAWPLPARVDPGTAAFELVLAGGEGVGLPKPRARELGDPLRRQRMQALVDAYAAARPERDAAPPLAPPAPGARAQAAERAERAEAGERGHRAVAGDARLALARAQRALAAAEERAAAAEERLSATRAELAQRAQALRDVETRLAGALETGARAERLGDELAGARERLAETESAAAAEREGLRARLDEGAGGGGRGEGRLGGGWRRE